MGLREVRLLKGLRGLTGLMWLLYIYCEIVRTPLGIGFMALWGFGAKSVTGWMKWMRDTPKTVINTRAPVVLVLFHS